MSIIEAIDPFMQEYWPAMLLLFLLVAPFMARIRGALEAHMATIHRADADPSE